LELVHDIVVNNCIELFLQLLQLDLVRLDFIAMRDGAVHILVEEQIEVDLLVKDKLGVVLYFFLEVQVVVNSVELEHHDVWWAADPCFKGLLLAWLVTFVVIKEGDARLLPGLVEVAFLDK
jgi:hypothetical protein